MDQLLCEMKGHECFVYLDDVIIFSETWEEHCKRVAKTLTLFRAANLKVKLKKCAFAQKEVHYLGHVVTQDGVKPENDKVEAVKNYPQPKNVRDIRAFLGLAGYYSATTKAYEAAGRRYGRI